MTELSTPIQQVVAFAAAKFEANFGLTPNRAAIHPTDFARRLADQDELLPHLIMGTDPEVAVGTARVWFDRAWHQQLVDSGLIEDTGG